MPGLKAIKVKISSRGTPPRENQKLIKDTEELRLWVCSAQIKMMAHQVLWKLGHSEV